MLARSMSISDYRKSLKHKSVQSCVVSLKIVRMLYPMPKAFPCVFLFVLRYFPYLLGIAYIFFISSMDNTRYYIYIYIYIYIYLVFIILVLYLIIIDFFKCVSCCLPLIKMMYCQLRQNFLFDWWKSHLPFPNLLPEK